MLVYLLLLTIPITVIALVVARLEYQRRGHLTWLGLTLILLMFLMPNLVIEYATDCALPRTLLDYIGILVGIIGVLLCLNGIRYFGSTSKVFCLDAGELTVSGPYRWSRNPQYAGWFLFLLGFCLTDWSLWCLAALTVVVFYIHMLVLIEEEHLRRVFGERYIEYCGVIPRYLGWRRLRL